MSLLQRLSNMNPIIVTIFAGIFTWLMTALGAGLVIFLKNLSDKLTNIMLGFASGVMLAASFWSLLDPAIEMSSNLGRLSFLPALIGFVAGGIFLRIIDKIVPHMHIASKQKDGSESHLSNSALLMLSITIHNIPEGLAVGVAFGAIAKGDVAALMSAIILTIGIGIQNLPEGAAVSIPLRANGMNRVKAFNYGQLSAIVEPISAILGCALVQVVTPILPYALAFAAGAMVYVVSEELIPSSQKGGGADLATMALIAGFCIMMTLDVALG